MPLTPEEEARMRQLEAELGAPPMQGPVQQFNNLTPQETARLAQLEQELAPPQTQVAQQAPSPEFSLDARQNIIEDLQQNSFMQNALIDIGANLSKVVPNIKRLIDPEDPEANEALREIERLQEMVRVAEPATVFAGDVALPTLGALPGLALTGTGAGTAATVSGLGALEASVLTPSEANPRVSAVFGAAAPFAPQVLARAGTRVGRAVGDTATRLRQRGAQARALTPEEQAANRLNRFIQEADLTPDEILARRAQLGEGSVLADVEPVQGFGQGVAVEPSNRRFIDFFHRRKQGEQARIIEALSEATGRRPQDFTGDVARFVTQRQNASAPLFEEAFSRPLVETGEEAVNLVPDFMQRLERVIPRLQGSGAFREAVDNAAIRGVPINLEDMSRMTFRDLHAAKEGLDDIIKNEIDKIANRQGGGSATRLRNLQELRTEYTNLLRNQNPRYADALNQYAGDSAVLNASELGSNAFKNRYAGQALNTDRLIREVSEMGEAELRAFQGGITRAIGDMLENVKETAAAAQKIWASPKIRERLRTAFSTDQEFDIFLDGLRTETAFTSTLRNLYQGSQTAPREIANQILNKPIGRLVEPVKEVFLGAMRPEAKRELSRLMFDPNVTNQELRRIMTNQGVIGEVNDRTFEQIRNNWSRIVNLFNSSTRGQAGAVLSPTAPRILEDENNG